MIGLKEHNDISINVNREFCETRVFRKKSFSIFRTLSFGRKICHDNLIDMILILVQFYIFSNVFS
jgi:hypothetical protein